MTIGCEPTVTTTMIFFALVGLALFSGNASAFAVTPVMAASTVVSTVPDALATKSVVTKVAVAGATGRTGRFVVEELLRRDVSVVAMVRDEAKAKEIFSDPLPEGLEVVECDLTSENEIDTGEYTYMVAEKGFCVLCLPSSHASGCDCSQPSKVVTLPFGVQLGSRMRREHRFLTKLRASLELSRHPSDPLTLLVYQLWPSALNRLQKKPIVPK